MVRSKLTDLSSELGNGYTIGHYKTGSDYHLEITQEFMDKNSDIDHINIITNYVGSISETYHTIRVLYDVVHNINMGHDLKSE